MDWQFGYNCRQYLPTLGKCRVLIEDRGGRDDLVEWKWLGIEDMLVYTEHAPTDLASLVDQGRLSVRRRKNGQLLFRVPASWAWDDCPLGDSGGQCLYFEEHSGHKISCLMDLETIEAAHPNSVLAPSDETLLWVDERFSHVLPGE